MPGPGVEDAALVYGLTQFPVQGVADLLPQLVIDGALFVPSATLIYLANYFLEWPHVAIGPGHDDTMVDFDFGPHAKGQRHLWRRYDRLPFERVNQTAIMGGEDR